LLRSARLPPAGRPLGRFGRLISCIILLVPGSSVVGLV
jgi:hypothetical protein